MGKACAHPPPPHTNTSTHTCPSTIFSRIQQQQNVLIPPGVGAENGHLNLQASVSKSVAHRWLQALIGPMRNGRFETMGDPKERRCLRWDGIHDAANRWCVHRQRLEEKGGILLAKQSSFGWYCFSFKVLWPPFSGLGWGSFAASTPRSLSGLTSSCSRDPRSSRFCDRISSIFFWHGLLCGVTTSRCILVHAAHDRPLAVRNPLPGPFAAQGGREERSHG